MRGCQIFVKYSKFVIVTQIVNELQLFAFDWLILSYLLPLTSLNLLLCGKLA